MVSADGNDTIRNFGDESYVNGELGNDSIIQEADYGESTLMGGAGDDTVNASASAGTNLIWGGDGSDTLIGSANTVQLETTNPDTGEPEPATDANGNPQFGPGDTLYGGDAAGEDTGADSLTAGNNSLMFGNKGSDTLVGTGINATLWGGQDGDSLLGAGFSYLSGDNGNDSLTVGTSTNNTLEGGDGNDSLYGLNPDDTTTGGSANSLSGGAGNDILVAGTRVGNSGEGETFDTLIGGAGNDFFFGSAGDDTIGGQEGTTREGSDTLYGGQGADSLIGTSGFDGFYYANNNEIVNAEGNSDTITAFQSGTDKIYLSSTAFGNTNPPSTNINRLGGGAGNQLRDGLDFESIGENANYTSLSGTFTGGTDAPAIVFDDTGDGGILYWDWNGGDGENVGGAGLSAIAVIERGSVQASDIVLF
jgi:Ca2+-binding RTX toxin-like protein